MHLAPDILIVDDQPMNLDLLARVLGDKGYKVRAVTSGERAIEAARHSRPDCLLLDVNMPGLDGYATCLALQTDPQLHDIPVIFLTAHDDTMHKLRAFGVGGRDYVTKPFEVDEVLARVQNQLRIAELERTLREQNEALNDANARLVEAGAQKARVTAMLVHDLRNPLMVIGAILDGALDSQSLADGRIAYQGVRKLLDTMLELSKNDATQPAAHPSLLDIGELVTRTVRLGQYVAEHRTIELNCKIPSPPLMVLGDPEQLTRVFSNLIGNALKFTPSGGKVNLDVCEERGAGVESGLRFARITVADTGAGIAPEELPFVFETYRQGNAGKQQGGVGLGLAIVARIVAAHGGRVRVLSQLNVGTEFHVLLPL